MDTKLKQIFTNWRVLIALVCIVLSIVAIHPSFDTTGVSIRNVVQNSSAAIAGIAKPAANVAPTARERIISVDNHPVNSLDDYFALTANLSANQTVVIRTSSNKNGYFLKTLPLVQTIVLNETEEKIVPEVLVNTTANGTIVNTTINKTVIVNKTRDIVIGVQDIGITVFEPPKTNLRKGLDLQGGTRVLLQPEGTVSEEDMSTIIDNMKERLNVFGISDVSVSPASDLSGNKFILVEIAGANSEEVKELLARQGKFEAKIGDNVAFVGGNRDVTYVCRSADCSGIDYRKGCQQSSNGWNCGFFFSITLSGDAAAKQASLTKDLAVVTESGQEYLNESIVLYLDDAEVDRLRIGADLKGNAATNIQISGSGSGTTMQEAQANSLANMKRLQTILITGSLPVKLTIVKTDTISPALGQEFLNSTYLIAILAMIVVALIIYIRYRRLEVSLPIILTMLVELIVIFGVAALIGWNIDLAAIAGILITIGTGVNDQIIIIDELLAGSGKEGTTATYDWKKRMGNAFFIIFGAYATIVVAMLPLGLAGAGLLKGFALTTIIGVSVGVFISRPAFAKVVEILLK